MSIGKEGGPEDRHGVDDIKVISSKHQSNNIHL